MAISKIQQGDNVQVIAGQYKGQQGIVVSVTKKVVKGKATRYRAAVNTLPGIVDYRKKNAQFSLPGEMKEKMRYLDVSNLALLDGKTVSRSRVEIAKDGSRTRVYTKSGKPVQKKAIPTEVTNEPKEDTK